ncbi:MAG TPA: multicopper oxidase domain-containing protein [Solirubrobacteraceae bacterium]|nr:multicopper oxidase domain-containing protein [Solirubrobacteraceae bacterium]
MSTTVPRPPEHDTPPELDYASAEGLADESSKERSWREWMMVGVGLTALAAIIAVALSLAAVAGTGDSGSSGSAAPAAPRMTAAHSATVSGAAAPTMVQAKGIEYERFEPVNPTLPAVPTGPTKKFTVSVIQHVVQVSPQLAPVQAWTYTVNGVAYRGTAASPPIVVNQGDHVQITFVNGTGHSSGVDMAHSIDIHAAQVAPNLNYIDVAPGHKKVITFTANYAGVFMYHCATQPVLMHTGAGMVGMLVVKPHNLPPASKQLWLMQGEYYIGKPGGLADEAKMAAEQPDVIAFNGYADQYQLHPITVPAGKTIRVFALNAGNSRWEAFHVIGTLFDTTDVEGVVGHGAQTISLAPSQGAWVDFKLAETGNYPFVTHSFGDMVKGAAGILHTPGAPAPTGAPAAPTGGSTAPVPARMATTMSPSTITAPAGAPAGSVATAMGDMWVRTATSTIKAGAGGKVTLAVTNNGQMEHWFAIMRAPAKLSGGTPVASAVLAKSEPLPPGQSADVTAKLAPGRYELVCLVPGHYMAGQHETITVTG